MNGAQWLVGTLKQRGVDVIFALCGNGLKPFLDACIDHQMQVIDVRNEQSAAYMADTWGRLTKRIGVVAVSAGPGHTNALTGLANAFWDGGPMLLISGCASMKTRGMGHFQELDQVEMATPVCKYARLITSTETLEHEFIKALRLAVSGRPGPVHLTVPVDVLSSVMPDFAVSQLQLSPPSVDEVNPISVGDGDLVCETVEELATADRPAIIVGNGIFYAAAWQPLAEFAEKTNIPIFSSMWSRGAIERSIPEYVGTTFSGPTNGAYSCLAETDVVLLLGVQVDYRMEYGRSSVFSDSTRFISVNSDPSIQVSDEKIKEASKKYDICKNNLNILLGIGGSGPTKRIPSKTYLQVMKKISKENNCKFFLATGKKEEEQRILSEIKNSDLGSHCVALDKLSINECLPIIKNCSLSICNDTSFSHLSSALSVETITLMADTPLMYGNYSSKMHPIIPDNETSVTHGTLGKDKINPDKIYEKLLSIIN